MPMRNVPFSLLKCKFLAPETEYHYNECMIIRTIISGMLAAFVLAALGSPAVNGGLPPKKQPSFPAIAMVNHVEFSDSAANNPLAGCSFLVKDGGLLLAVTCKHALWVAKSAAMKGVHFEGTLKEWRMQRKDDTTKFVLMDTLVNADRTEAIGEQNVDSDYLVFTIRENRSDVTPLTLRRTPLRKGEPVYILGWSFSDRTGPQRTYKAVYYKSTDNHILVSIEEQKNLAGISGGPVVDANGELVGIVSNYAFDKASKKWFGSPCGTGYLTSVIGRLKDMR